MPCPNGVSRLKSRSLFVSHPGNLHSVEILSDQTAIAEAAHACRRAELAGAVSWSQAGSVRRTPRVPPPRPYGALGFQSGPLGIQFRSQGIESRIPASVGTGGTSFQ
jgi:hypothetical protein